MDAKMLDEFAKELHAERIAGNPAKMIHSTHFFWLSAGKAIAINQLEGKMPNNNKELGESIVSAAKWILDVSNNLEESKIINLATLGDKIISRTLTPDHINPYWKFLRAHTLIQKDDEKLPEVWEKLFKNSI